jgi:hypothetical protein
MFTAWCVPYPIHQLKRPPNVLPAVAKKIAAQNKSGLSLTNQKTAGSEPKGKRVAEMNAMVKTVDKPCWGNASQAKSCVMRGVNHSCI